jgi:hypothetical protein
VQGGVDVWVKLFKGKRRRRRKECDIDTHGEKDYHKNHWLGREKLSL